MTVQVCVQRIVCLIKLICLLLGKSIVAALESTPLPTIRHVDCVPKFGGSCHVCVRYRDILYALPSKQKKNTPTAPQNCPVAMQITDN